MSLCSLSSIVGALSAQVVLAGSQTVERKCSPVDERECAHMLVVILILRSIYFRLRLVVLRAGIVVDRDHIGRAFACEKAFTMDYGIMPTTA